MLPGFCFGGDQGLFAGLVFCLCFYLTNKQKAASPPELKPEFTVSDKPGGRSFAHTLLVGTMHGRDMFAFISFALDFFFFFLMEGARKQNFSFPVQNSGAEGRCAFLPSIESYLSVLLPLE